MTPTSDGGTPPAPPPDMATPYMTAIPPIAPQVDPGSANVVAAPRIIPIFFRNDSFQSGLTSFIQNYVTNSNSWAVLQEYGVGRGSVAPAVVLSFTPATMTSDLEVANTIVNNIQNGTLPKNDASTIYIIYYPSGITITSAAGTSCVDYAAYHQTTILPDNTRAPYAVIPRCRNATLAVLTYTSSHELVEAATDPHLVAYNFLKSPYSLWAFALNGPELSDLCENITDTAYAEAGVGVVARTWSNRAMAMWKNPCLPLTAANSDFFAIPVMNALVPVSINGRLTSIEVVSIAAGREAVIPVHLYGTSATNPTWRVSVEEVPLPTQSGGMGTPALSMTWQEAPTQPSVQGQSGALFHLRVAVAASAPPGLTTFRVISTGSGAVMPQTMWVGSIRIL